MKIKGLFFLALLVSSHGLLTSTGFAQGTVFTYQGRLNSGASPYTGVAEIQPTLWDAASAGSQLAGNNPPSVIVNVTNGLFVLPLDFGNAPFAGGADRWLEIQLRTALGPFTTLTPRQKLTPTPYAIRAANAATAGTANSVAAANITGTLALAQLPGVVVTNNQTGVNFTGSFAGNGGGLSNLSASSLVLTTSNVSITAWGRNDYGQRIIPAGLDDVVAVSPGALHSLALKADGTVVAWGAGQTNDPANLVDSGQSIVPPGLANVTAISAGYLHSLALRADRTVVAWGWNGFNQTDVPASVNNIIAISAGGYHNLALKADGTVVGWGTNIGGALEIPPGLNNVTAASAGFFHGLALKADGNVVVWGNNEYGQTNVPGGLSSVIAISAGAFHSLALKADGTVLAWGAGLTNDPSSGIDYGQSIVPPGLGNVTAIAAGYLRSLALKADGTIVGWGSAEHGADVPPGLNNVVAIGAGSTSIHGLVLRKRFDGPVAVRDSDNTFNGSIQVNGDARVTGELAAGGGLRLNDANLWLRGDKDQKNALGWYGPGKNFGNAEPDGPVLFGNAGGALGTSGTNGLRTALEWDASGHVGIGTSPTSFAPLSLGGFPSDTLLRFGGTSGIGVRSSQFRFHLNGGGHFSFLDSAAGTEVFTISTFGGVGIGTPSPTARLDVRGDIRFGSSGQYYPPAAEENLRIIRGVLTAAGGIIVGTGFTVTKGTAGLYTIRFTTLFSAAPTVTATADSQGGNPRVAMTDGVTATLATIRIVVSTTGASIDAPVHFTAIGPR
jgi:alpha-tubulin suppressor-like RCC1 family protein